MRGERKRQSWLRDDEGAALVEFAMVLPLLLVLVIGIFEFGRAWNINQVMTDAAREGARRAVVANGADQAEVYAAIENRLNTAGIASALVEVDPICTAGWSPPQPQAAFTGALVYGCGWEDGLGSDARVAIQIEYPFEFLAPILRLVNRDSDMGPTVMATNFLMRNE